MLVDAGERAAETDEEAGEGWAARTPRQQEAHRGSPGGMLSALQKTPCDQRDGLVGEAGAGGHEETKTVWYRRLGGQAGL